MIKTFSQFLSEGKAQLDWEASPKLGWWEDNKHITLYHGTHQRNLESVLKHGLTKMDPDTGHISLAFEPNTAHGYASMSGSGGESSFRKVGNKPQHTPENERVVVKYKIPKSWLHDKVDPHLGGNIGGAKERLQNKYLYDKWNETHHGGNDQGYYALSELRVKHPVPAKFAVGYMRKKK